MAAPTQPTTNGDRGTWGPLMTAWMNWVEGSLGGTESIDQLGIGTDSPDGKLDVRDGIIVLSDADVTNPMTGVMTSTNAYGKMNPFNSEVGGLRVLGASDAGTGLGISVEGMIGSTNPTDTVPACKFRGSKSDGGTSIAALGDAETVFQFDNFNTSLLTILGNGNVGIGVETPDAKLEVADSLPVLIHLDETDSGGGLLRFTNTTDTDGWYAGITGTEKFAIGRNIDPDIGNALIIQQDGTITFSGNLAADGDVSIGNDTAVDSKFYVLSAISGEYSAKFENTHADGHGIFSKVNNADTNRAALHVANNTQDIFYLTNAGSLSLNGIKSGTDQSDAGAAAGELYQDTNDDNTIKIGV